MHFALPFPEVFKPTKRAINLQKKIKIMFGIDVEPVIIREKGSYNKKFFRLNWSMKTPCGQYEISCIETVDVMISKNTWRVIDEITYLVYPNEDGVIGKIIY